MASRRPNFQAGRQKLEHRIFMQFEQDRSTGLLVPFRGRRVALSSLSTGQIAELARQTANEDAREGVRRHDLGE